MNKSYKKKKRLKSACDKLWYQVYLKPKCEICDRVATQVHHYYPKGLYGHLRYDKDNGISLCAKHHFFHHHRGDPTVVQDIIKARGKKWLNRLTSKARNREKTSYTTLKYYNDIYKKLERKT